ncbi:ABC transporter permease [Leptolyngbya sp. 'hensonii']|uniref:ABC transporter permease n=1 Tax=Leptolyngbya sp. 'hensonii' TaxID=1922337 RepID=UPI0009500310|nr:ABC transporter permease [Leptolyngbya sp. 'hensonii']OLP16169.1 ABC transporter permease [Leptolyngbya sp. 'hensonii']
MDLVESVKMATTTLAANKLRSALTMLGIIIGNASVIAMVGIGQGAQRYAASQFESLGPNVLFVIPGTDSARNRTFEIPKTLVLADADAIATQVPTVREVAPQIQRQLTVAYRGRSKNNLEEVNKTTLVLGTTPSFVTVRNFEVATGRFMTQDDVKEAAQVVVLGSELAQSLFGRDPKKIVGEQLRINNLPFQVIGVLKEKGDFLGSSQDDLAVIPWSTMSNRIVGRTSPYGIEVTAISMSARDEKSVPAAEFQVANLLRLRHQITREDDFTVRSQKSALQIIGNITGALTVMLAAIAGISLLVGGIGIMNIMLVSVTERTQEIGLRKAIGASQQDILIQFMIEAMILSALGGLVGTLVGSGGVLVVGLIFPPLQAGISVPAVLLAVGVSGGIGLFFGVLPAQRAAQLDPIVALRTA